MNCMTLGKVCGKKGDRKLLKNGEIKKKEKIIRNVVESYRAAIQEQLKRLSNVCPSELFGLQPGVNFINVLRTNFSYQCPFWQLFLDTFQL